MHLALILMAKIVTIIVTSKNFKGFSEKLLTAVCFPRKLSWVLECYRALIVFYKANGIKRLADLVWFYKNGIT